MSPSGTCPSCGRSLVYCAFGGGGVVYPAWVCDCLYREDLGNVKIGVGIAAAIVREREWDNPAIAVSIPTGALLMSSDDR